MDKWHIPAIPNFATKIRVMQKMSSHKSNFKNKFLNLPCRIQSAADILKKHLSFCLTENLDNSLRASKRFGVALLEYVYASVPPKRDGGLYTIFRCELIFNLSARG